MKKVLTAAVVWSLFVIFPEITPGGEAAEAPGELCRKAYLLERDARKAICEEDLLSAYEALSGALEVYEEIGRIYPEWRPEAIRGRIEALRGETITIGRKIFTLPEGAVEIGPEMVREGSRYNDGRLLAGKVTAAGEDRYEVDGSTVTIFREGPLAGASCTCPDFTYRGSRHGFACKHIWAVVFREKMLE